MKKSYWKVSLNHTNTVYHSVHNSRGFLENSRIRDASLGGIAARGAALVEFNVSNARRTQPGALACSSLWCLQNPGLELRSISRKHFLWMQGKFPYTLKIFLVLGLDHVEERKEKRKEEIKRK